MRLQGAEQVAGQRLHDATGRLIGRIVTVGWAADNYAADWFVVRLTGLRRRLRAVPADRASCTLVGLGVLYSVPEVRNSPDLTATWSAESSDVPLEVTRYYELLSSNAESPA